jgi:plasmid stabilization system protein ParE
MARHVRYALAARRFVLAELAYLAERSAAAAIRFQRDVDAAVVRIDDYPEIGSSGPRPGTRRLIVGPYVLTYRVAGEDIEVIAMRHGRQADPTGPARTPSPAREEC